MNDWIVGFAFLSLIAIPVIVASLKHVPMDEGHGAYTMGDRGFGNSGSRQRPAA